MYDDLVKRLRADADYMDNNGIVLYAAAPFYRECADAIEELSLVAESNERSAARWAETAGKVVEQIPRWISVTERCPEKSGDYLVFDDCRNLYVNEWHCLLKKWQYDDSRITHWMPLPSTEGLDET